MSDVAVTLTLPPPAVTRRRPSGITLIDESIKELVKGATDISWAHLTFNVWAGCAHDSDACKFCYAETMSHRFAWGKVDGVNVWGKHAPRHHMSDAYWKQPAAWNRLAGKLGVRLRVFCASLADVFEDRRDLDAERARLWDVIEATPNLDWLLLTKRPQHIPVMVPARWMTGDWPVNCWVGATMEDQRQADRRTRHLRAVPAPVIFASYAPALGPVMFDLDVVDWVIYEGESGHEARPAHPNWARDARDQCAAAGVAFHVKQIGEWTALEATEPPAAGASARYRLIGHNGPLKPGERGFYVERVGIKKAGRLLDGVEWMQIPVSPASEVAA